MSENKVNEHDIPQIWTAVSHEIRTPLNVIMGMTDISENEIYDVDLMKDCLSKIRTSTEALQLVVNALVDHADITSRKVKITKSKLDFKNLITDIAMHSYLLSKQKKCHFNMHVQDVTEEALVGDEARISQVLLAMLNLVVRFTSSAGVIDFTVLQTGISNSSVFMRFALRSTALEFPDEIVGFLNDNRLYMDPDLLAPVGAFGLTEMNALYISYLMNGTIHAENHQGDYSEIFLDMEFGRTQQPYSENGNRLFSHQRILIVADKEEVCNERGKMLVDMGMTYDSATDVDAALDMIGEAENEKKPFTICIIDWDMENRRCTQLIQEIREIFGKDLTILATAHDPEHHTQEAQRYGADYVIDRTIFRSTLFDALISVEDGVAMRINDERDEMYDFSGSRILVAEDVPLNMEVITKLLTRVHCEVTCVENGAEAVLQFEKKPAGYFNVILMDINMPDMDGYEAAAAIRKSDKENATHVPIYAMTANAFKEDVEKALACGMDGHIAKPIDVHALYRILDTVLNKNDESVKRLMNLAEQDPLTGCLNRRGFEHRCEDPKVSSGSIAYFEVDLDDFKEVNDHFGHETGDAILKKVVRVLKSTFNTDFVVRLGGDEFAMVLTDYQRQSSFLTRTFEEINEELTHPEDGLPPVMISVGACLSEDGYSDQVYSRADQALYKSKNSGKAVCTVFNDEEGLSRVQHEVEESLYTESLHYLDDQRTVFVENSTQIRSMLMVHNRPVGYMTGFFGGSYPIYSFNGFMPHLLGYTIEEFREAGRHGLAYFIHKDDQKRVIGNSGVGVLEDTTARIRTKNGDYIWFSVCYVIERTADNQLFWMSSYRCVDDLLVGDLVSQDYRMVSTIDPVNDTIVIEKGAYLIGNKDLQVQKTYNYSALNQEVFAHTIQENERREFLEKSELKRIVERLALVDGVEYTAYQDLGTGAYNAVRHKYHYMNEREDQILYTWEVLGDRAQIDDLTSVLNETGFYRVTQTILKDANNESAYDVLYFNISGFKGWNSMLGKEGADHLLKEVALAIMHSTLNPLIVSRFFSDHFVCLVDRGHRDNKELSRLCNSSFEIDGNHVCIQMRCGIYPITQNTEDIRSMCDKAKLAKTQITNEHALPYQMFDRTMNERYLQHLHVVNNVGHALERKEFKVYYHPIVDVQTGKIVSAEALIRWALPGNLVLSPAVFVPALEEQGYIADVDMYSQSVVMELLNRRSMSNKHIVPVSVNASRMDFLNSRFVEQLKNLCNASRILRENLKLEVTESSYTEIGQSGEDLLAKLRTNGIVVMMDDFGTGVSTLSGLTSQMFDIVKIDMSFIRGIGKNNGSEAVIQNVISMCHALALQVVAEGVETKEQFDFLKKVNCDMIQGYYFYKPMPEEEFEKLLDEAEQD